MNNYSALNISAAGLSLERFRLDLASLNVANMNSASRQGETYLPKYLATNAMQLGEFDALLNYQSIQNSISIVEGRVKSVYEPEHPFSNEKGFVEYPDVNPLTEMMTVMSATRAYEANTRAFNASKLLLEETLRLGK